MKVSCAVGYALVGLAHLVRQPDGQPITAQDIAEAAGVLRKPLGNSLRALAQARILCSLKGRGGGFRLLRPLGEIILLEVVEAVDGSLGGEAPEILEGCGNAEGHKLQRQLQTVCDEATRVQREVLAAVRVADLVEQSKIPGGRKKGK